MQGTPQTMQVAPHYEDVVAEVLDFLWVARERALGAGVLREGIWLDPGIGFGKSVGHNLFLLRRMQEFRVLGQPLLVGPSRKGMIGKVTGRPVEQRTWGTLGSIAALAAWNGADVVRVHDVAEARDVLAVVDAIRSAKEGGSLYGACMRGGGAAT